MIDNTSFQEAVDHIEELTAIVIWMSGSEDFNPNGPGGAQWEVQREKLFAALEWLDVVRPDEDDEGPEQLVLFDVDDFDNTWQS